MWRSRFLFRSVISNTANLVKVSPHHSPNLPPSSSSSYPYFLDLFRKQLLCSTSESGNVVRSGEVDEARKLMRLVNVESLKKKLEIGGEEVIGYNELLKVCQDMGVVKDIHEAKNFAKVLDDAGVVVLFRDKVYLHPDKVVDLMKKAIPLVLTSEADPRREELKQLQKAKDHIDILAHKQVRQILWSGLGFFVAQTSVFFRLTFWEFSWDVMEPVAFFTTTSGLIVGYAYFLFTSRDPTYQDLMKRLYLSRRRKLIQKHKFDINRFLELQKHCKCPLEHIDGLELDETDKI
ncbi:hypothetical protein ZOSMA_192G00250 [Zostera marina]|uniref:Calcium uniporter protein C-terminal domain-containing protein n=1 Tax=Zostera marina TaxID=29655 RepID=A0A0K9PP51_ZOSMR|nr:hypothetical protein ZOSMA_192G00250 [Zostera marina]